MLMLWNWITNNALKFAAVLLLLLSVWLALMDRTPAATLIAGLFIVVVLFHYLPQMESFKAYGVEAKWRQKLNEADEILRKLKRSTLASARLTYHTLGWGSRMGGPRLEDKQAIADEVDAALLDLGFDPVQVTELKKDYIFFAKFDVFQTFDAIVDVAINETTNRTDASVVPKRGSIDLLSVLPNVMFREFCQERIPGGLTERATEILRRFANAVADIIDDCEKTGRVSAEAMKLIKAYNIEDRKKLYSRLFSKDEHRS